jgi:hypothetical protein
VLNHNSVFFGGDTVSRTNVKVNAVSGGIVKNHASSFFLRFHLKSSDAEALLSPKPGRWITVYESYDRDRKWPKKEKKPVEVLQLVIVGDMEVVAEVIDIPLEDKQETQL